MARILLFVFVAFLAWLVVRIVGRRRDDGPAAPSADRPAADPPGAIEAVAQCAWCGVHVPAAAARTLPDGRLYCGDAHREAARAIASSDGRRA